jgi:hypothetical protein
MYVTDENGNRYYVVFPSKPDPDNWVRLIPVDPTYKGLSLCQPAENSCKIQTSQRKQANG